MWTKLPWSPQSSKSPILPNSLFFSSVDNHAMPHLEFEQVDKEILAVKFHHGHDVFWVKLYFHFLAQDSVSNLWWSGHFVTYKLFTSTFLKKTKKYALEFLMSSRSAWSSSASPSTWSKLSKLVTLGWLVSPALQLLCCCCYFTTLQHCCCATLLF